MITKETLNTAVSDICQSLDNLDRTLDTRADGTNWTMADSLSNIAYELGRIADAMEKSS